MAFLNAGLYQDPILDDRGNALPQASVQVNLVGGGAATLYTSRTKAVVAANPVTTAGVGSTIDANANLSIYTDPGPYDLVITVDGVVTTVRITVPIDPDEAAQDTDVSLHLSDASDAHDASAISFVPAGTIVASNVQAAIEEVASEAGGDVAAHLADGTDAHDASAVSFVAVGTIASTDVQSAVAEVATDAAASLSGHAAAGDPHPGYATDADVATVASDLASHLGDPTAAHAASAVSFIAGGSLASTDVQSAIAEVATDYIAADAAEASARAAADAAHTAATTGVHGVGASTVESASGAQTKATAAQAAAEATAAAALLAHENDTVDAHDASAISYIPSTGIADTTVQAAIASRSSGKSYVLNYTSADRTLNDYLTDGEATAYTGIASGVGGTPYAQLADVNALRVAYENLRASHDDLLGTVVALINDLTTSGVVATIVDPSPPVTPSPILWYDASDITGLNDGDPIASWPDKTGGGRHLQQATGSKQPLFKASQINGRPAARFDGTNDLLASIGSISQAQPLTYYFVMKVATYATGKNPMDSVSGVHASLEMRGEPTRYDLALQAGGSPNNLPYVPFGLGAWNVLTAVADGSSSGVQRNGGSVFGPGIAGTTGATGLQGGLSLGSAFNGSNSAAIDVAEVLIYAGHHSDADKALVHASLLTKYKLPTSQLVFDGDSMTLATSHIGAGPRSLASYPNQVLGLLTSGPRPWNFGVGSATVADMIADAATQIDPLYTATIAKNIVLLWGGTNDLFFGASAATTYNRIVSYCQARRAAGWKVIVFTILPRSSSGTPGTFEADRQTVNANIRANYLTFADAVADVGANSLIGDAGDETNATYYADIGVHLNTAGYAVVAGIVKTALATLGVS